MSSSSSQSTSSQNCPPFIWRIWAIWYILIFHSCHLGKLSPIGDKYCKSVAKENLGEIPMQWYFMLQKPKYSGNPKVKFSKDQHFSHISPWKGKVKSSHHDHLHLQGPKRCTTTLIERNISNAFQVEYLETSNELVKGIVRINFYVCRILTLLLRRILWESKYLHLQGDTKCNWSSCAEWCLSKVKGIFNLLVV